MAYMEYSLSEQRCLYYQKTTNPQHFDEYLARIRISPENIITHFIGRHKNLMYPFILPKNWVTKIKTKNNVDDDEKTKIKRTKFRNTI